MTRIDWRFVVVSALTGAVLGFVWSWFGYPSRR